MEHRVWKGGFYLFLFVRLHQPGVVADSLVPAWWVTSSRTVYLSFEQLPMR